MMADTDTTTTETETDQTTEPAADAGDKAKPQKTYSKSEVDAMVNKARAATRREFSNYEELKTKADELDALRETSKTEEVKLRERADKAVRERDTALTRARETLVRSSIVAAAARLGVVDPEAVAALLPKDELIIEGDEVLGVEEAVRALLVKKPYLRGSAGSRGGSEMTGSGQEPAIITRSQIRRWAREGNLTPERQQAIQEAQRAGRIRADA